MNKENYKPGQIVRFSKPADAAESAAKFKVIEDNGDRVLIQLICKMPIPPTQMVPKNEIEAE